MSKPICSIPFFPLGMRLSYFEARKLACDKSNNGFPSSLPSRLHFLRANVLTENWKTVEREYPLWGRELYAYPAIDSTFIGGEPIVDAGTGLIVLDVEHVLAASTYAGTLNKGMVLVIKEIAEIGNENGKIIIIPRVITSIHDVVRSITSPIQGPLDDNELLPIDRHASDFDQVGAFWTRPEMGVRPAVYYVSEDDSRTAVRADVSHTTPVGVAIVDEESERIDWSRYSQESPSPTADPEVLTLIRQLEEKWGVKR